MLQDRSIHRLFSSPDLPNNSSDLSSGNPLTPHESPMSDSGSQTIMPALLVNRASTLSDHRLDTLHHFPSQAYTGPESSYIWPQSEQSTTFGHTSFNCRVEPSSSALRSRASFANVENPAEGEDSWSIGSHQQLPTPFSSASSSFNNYSLEMEEELTTSAQSELPKQSHIPLTSGHLTQLPPWKDSTAVSSFEVTSVRPRYTPPHAYACDTAPSFGSSLYATSSDLRTPNRPKLHGPARRTELLDHVGSESESEGRQGEPPYAKLIYRALMDAPDHQMVLKDIYTWIAQNTDKARDPAFKGWQNSVRHNLSMNGAFRKVPYVDPCNKAKKGFIWVLEPSAVGVGIQSTTRYRQKTVSKRGENVDQADPKRQRSGKKGGRATGKSVKLRRSALVEHNARYAPYPKGELGMTSNGLPGEPLQHPSPHQDWNSIVGLPYYLTPPLSSTQPSFPETSFYNYRATTEDSESQQHGVAFDRGNQPLFGHSFDSGCETLQHEGFGIVKFEDQRFPNRLTALS